MRFSHRPSFGFNARSILVPLTSVRSLAAVVALLTSGLAPSARAFEPQTDGIWDSPMANTLLLESSGDRVTDEAGYVGTLRNIYNADFAAFSSPLFRSTSGGTSALLAPLVPNAPTADQSWTGGGTGNNTAWFTTGNWAGGAFPGATPSPANTTNTDIATIGSTGSNPDIGINLNFTGSTLGLGAINFNGANRGIGNSSNAAGAQNGTLRLNGATVNGTPNVILRNFGSGTLTLYASTPGGGSAVVGPMTVTLGNATDNIINIDSTGGITINSVIKNGAGNHITLNGVSGSGPLRLAGANTYTGGTTLNSGTLQLGSSSTGSVTNGPVGTGTLTLNGGTLSSDSTTARSIANAITLGGDVTLGNGTNNGTLTLSGDGTLAAFLTLTVNSDVTYSGVIGQSGGTRSLNKAGAGTLTLSGANTYSGATSITDGTLKLSGAGTLGTTTTPLSVRGSGVLDLGGTNQTVGNLSNFSGGGTITNNTGASTLTIGNDNTGATFTGLISDGGGTLALTKTGSGNQFLDHANTYSGDTVISGGTLGLFNSLAIQNSTLNYDNQGGSLTFTVLTSATFGGLKGAQNLALTNQSSNPVALSVGKNNQNTTYSGTLSGGGSLTKIGSGTLILTGASTYTGTTTISASGGTLSLDNNNTTTARLGGTSGITVNAGGTLLLAQSGGTASTNRINDSATMTMSGGTFNTAGLSENNLSGLTVTPGIGALTLTSNSIIDLASGASILSFANSSGASWTAATTLSIWNWSGTPTTGNGTDQIYFGTDATGLTAGQLLQISFYSDAGTTFLGTGVFGVDLDGEVVPTAVPEPSTWIGAAAAGLLVISYRLLGRKRPKTLKS